MSRGAIPFIEGRRRLAELGLDEDIEKLAKQMASGPIIRSTPVPTRLLDGQRLSPTTSDCVSEASNA